MLLYTHEGQSAVTCRESSCYLDIFATPTITEHWTPIIIQLLVSIITLFRRKSDIFQLKTQLSFLVKHALTRRLTRTKFQHDMPLHDYLFGSVKKWEVVKHLMAQFEPFERNVHSLLADQSKFETFRLHFHNTIYHITYDS